MNRTARATAKQSRRIQRYAGQTDAYSLFNLLTGPELFDALEAALPPHRERLYPPTETLSIFLAQALSTDRSCQRAVDEFAVRRIGAGLSSPSIHTGGYCRARARLPLEMVCALARQTGRQVSTGAPCAWHWRGRAVRMVDGTTLTLPDTRPNQDRFPQSRSQKPGLGSPLCRVVGVVCLGSGALLDAAIGPFRGKGSDEGALLCSVLDSIVRGDMVLGDAYFKGTLQLLLAFQQNLRLSAPRSARRMTAHLLGAISMLVLLVRPGRVEPHAIKRRPKNHALLTALARAAILRARAATA